MGAHQKEVEGVINPVVRVVKPLPISYDMVVIFVVEIVPHVVSYFVCSRKGNKLELIGIRIVSRSRNR